MIRSADSMDFYYRLRHRMQQWSGSAEARSMPWLDIVLLAPDLLHLILRLSADPDVPLSVKGRLMLAVAYLINPFDLMPEIFIGPGGFLDDVVVMVYVLHGIFQEVPADLLESHWAGEKKLLNTLESVILRANKVLGSGLMKKIKTVLVKS